MASNVNCDNFIPQLWDASVLRTLEDNLVAKQICNVSGTEQIKAFGDTVFFNGLSDPTVDDYTGTITYEALVDSQVALLINQQKYYAFKVTDPEQAMANVDLKGSQADRAAYSLKKACDTVIMGEYANAYHTVQDTTCTTTNILSDIGLAKQYLAENNVNENDMYLVIPPWVQLKLELAGIVFSINEGINGKGGMNWAKVLGFDVFVTNQVANTNTTVAPYSQCLAGSYNSIVFADRLETSEMFRSQDTFEYYCRGLHIFGVKTVKPKELVKLDLRYTAETTI